MGCSLRLLRYLYCGSAPWLQLQCQAATSLWCYSSLVRNTPRVYDWGELNVYGCAVTLSPLQKLSAKAPEVMETPWSRKSRFRIRSSSGGTKRLKSTFPPPGLDSVSLLTRSPILLPIREERHPLETSLLVCLSEHSIHQTIPASLSPAGLSRSRRLGQNQGDQLHDVSLYTIV